MSDFVYKRADRKRRDRAWLRNLRRARRRVSRPIVRWLAPKLVRALARSWRAEVLHPERRERAAYGESGVILAFWHGRMLAAFSQFMDDDLTILVSVSGDGGLAVDLLAAFGCEIIRGSSSGRGARAMREMLGALRADASLVVTPDGPRGPLHKIEPGIAFLARETGLPILPVGFAAERAWHLNSWDNYTIPAPRTRVLAAFGEPLRVEPSASSTELTRVRAALGATLIDLEREAFAQLGAEVDF